VKGIKNDISEFLKKEKLYIDKEDYDFNKQDCPLELFVLKTLPKKLPRLD